MSRLLLRASNGVWRLIMLAVFRREILLRASGFRLGPEMNDRGNQKYDKAAARRQARRIPGGIMAMARWPT